LIWLGIAEPIYPIKEKTYFPAIRTDKKSPVNQARKKWAKKKKEWTFEWNEEVPLSETDYQILENHFLTQQGNSFFWPHYVTGVIHKVTFYQDSLNGDILVPGYRTATVILREV
jgi:hypothetical protein